MRTNAAHCYAVGKSHLKKGKSNTALFEAFQADRAMNARPSSIRLLEQRIKQFLALLETRGLQLTDTTSDDLNLELADYRQQLVQAHLKPSTIRGKLKVAIQFLAWLGFSDVTVTAPRHQILRRQHRDDLLDVVLTNDEVNRLVRAARHHQMKGLLLAFISTCARANELLPSKGRTTRVLEGGIKLGDVDLQCGEVRIRWSKSATRTVQLCPRARKHLRLYLNTERGSPAHDYFFTNDDGNPLTYDAVRRMLNGQKATTATQGYPGLLEQAGLHRRQHKITLHVLRKTGGTRLWLNGMHGREFWQYMGWTDSSGPLMESIYVGLDQRQSLPRIRTILGYPVDDDSTSTMPPVEYRIISEHMCPNCLNPVDPAAINCVLCGFDLTRKQGPTIQQQMTGLQQQMERVQLILTNVCAEPSVREKLPAAGVSPDGLSFTVQEILAPAIRKARRALMQELQGKLAARRKELETLLEPVELPITVNDGKRRGPK